MIRIILIATVTFSGRTLTLNTYDFIDSMSFLDGSLAAVVDDLVKSGHDFQLLDESGMCKNAEEKTLLLRKGN